MRKQGSGWKKESRRHSLARKGIKTANGIKAKRKNEILKDFFNYSFKDVDFTYDNLTTKEKKILSKEEFEELKKEYLQLKASGNKKEESYEDSIYTILKDKGIPLDSHESDLYVKATPESIELTKDIETREFFKSNIDGTLWIVLPFRYDPFWIKKQKHIAKGNLKTKKWEVVMISPHGRTVIEEISLGRQSNKFDVVQQLKREGIGGEIVQIKEMK